MKTSIAITIDEEINKQLDDVKEKTLAGKSAIVNNILKNHFQKESGQDKEN
jgi:predicted transcriptional regulator